MIVVSIENAVFGDRNRRYDISQCAQSLPTQFGIMALHLFRLKKVFAKYIHINYLMPSIPEQDISKQCRPR